jgi:hypothetical protein
LTRIYGDLVQPREPSVTVEEEAPVRVIDPVLLGAVSEEHQQVFERVRDLHAEGHTKRDACQLVASSTGLSAGTVTSIFYRVAKFQPDKGGVRTGMRGKNKLSLVAGLPDPNVRHSEPPTSLVSEALLVQARSIIERLGGRILELERENYRLENLLRGGELGVEFVGPESVENEHRVDFRDEQRGEFSLADDESRSFSEASN